MLSERLAEKTQRLIDEYLGAVGSAAIVSRAGTVLFCSARDDSACGLLPTFDRVPCASIVDDVPTVVNLPVSRAWCSYGVALDAWHVLFVVAAPAVAPGVIATRMKTAASLLRRVLAAGADAAPSGTGGASGAPALAGLVGSAKWSSARPTFIAPGAVLRCAA
ncbi:MAG TPA: hypothetical protein VGH28_10040 [Polyangiaceae bacterium]|jgi:hypothetical protein